MFIAPNILISLDSPPAATRIDEESNDIQTIVANL